MLKSSKNFSFFTKTFASSMFLSPLCDPFQIEYYLGFFAHYSHFEKCIISSLPIISLQFHFIIFYFTTLTARKSVHLVFCSIQCFFVCSMVIFLLLPNPLVLCTTSVVYRPNPSHDWFCSFESLFKFLGKIHAYRSIHYPNVNFLSSIASTCWLCHIHLYRCFRLCVPLESGIPDFTLLGMYFAL